MYVSCNVFNSLSTPCFVQHFSGNSSVNLFAVYFFTYKLFVEILSLSVNTMLIVDKHCSGVCCDEFLVPQIDRKSNYQKNSDMENFICNQNGERRPISKPENIKICGRVTKLEAIRMQYACIFFHRYCSNMPKVRWAMSYVFCSKFRMLSSSAKILRIG